MGSVTVESFDALGEVFVARSIPDEGEYLNELSIEHEVIEGFLLKNFEVISTTIDIDEMAT